MLKNKNFFLIFEVFFWSISAVRNNHFGGLVFLGRPGAAAAAAVPSTDFRGSGTRIRNGASSWAHFVRH